MTDFSSTTVRSMVEVFACWDTVYECSGVDYSNVDVCALKDALTGVQ